MNEHERVKEFGFTTGQDAGILRELGATPEQVRNYVRFSGLPLMPKYYGVYLRAARCGFLLYHERFVNPVYALHIERLRELIRMNGASLR